MAYIDDDTGVLKLYKGLIKDPTDIFTGIYNSDWKQETIKVFGQTYQPKRLTCSYGDPYTKYKYSGKTELCAHWSTNPSIVNLRDQIKELTGTNYNFALCNFYADETSTIGYHSDNEKDLDPNYYICSVSLGATREFRVQPITKKFDDLGKTRPNLIKIDLEEGDILVMGGNLQSYWKHCIFKSSAPCGPRINITFRMINTL